MPALTEYEQYQQRFQQSQQQSQQQQQQQGGGQGPPQHAYSHPQQQQQQQGPPSFHYPSSSSSPSSQQPGMSHSQHYQSQHEQQQQQQQGGGAPPNSNLYSNPPPYMMRPQPGQPGQPSFPSNAAFQHFNPGSNYAMQSSPYMMPPPHQPQAQHPGQQHSQAQYLQPNPYLSATQLPNGQNRPLLVAGRIIPHPQFYPYELKPGRMPPFDLLAAQLHKKKVNLACHFCDHAARRPGRQKTALLISCQSPHCRKVFCSRPSCFKKLPAELGIQSPDRFCEWKRQVESGVAGFTFICPHCRDEAGCPGPQCAKRWKKRLARANNKRGVNGKEEGGDGEEGATPEQPMKKELLLTAGGAAGQAGQVVAAGEVVNGHGGMNGNGGVSKAVKGDEGETAQTHEGMYAHPAMLQMQQAAANGGVPQQRSPSGMPTLGEGVAYPPSAATMKAYSVYQQSNDPNAQPRTSMDVLAGVSNMGEVQDVSAHGGNGASADESTPAAHQQLLQFLQQRQKQEDDQAHQQQQQQQSQSVQQPSNEAIAQPAITPAGYSMGAYPSAVPATNPAGSPPASSAAAAQYAAYNNGGAGAAAGGQSFFTSPHLSPMMSPQPTALAVPGGLMGANTPHFSSHASHGTSPSLGPLSPMAHNQSPATAFYANTQHLMPSVPQLSLGANGSHAGGEQRGAVVEVGQDGQPMKGEHNGDAAESNGAAPVSVQ